MQMVQTFSRCILGSADEVDLDELLSTKLVTFMLNNHHSVLQVPSNLRRSVDEHLSHLRRAQVRTINLFCIRCNKFGILLAIIIIILMFIILNLKFSFYSTFKMF